MCSHFSIMSVGVAQLAIFKSFTAAAAAAAAATTLSEVTRGGNNFRYCNISNVVPFNHNELWNSLTMNSLSVTSRMLWPSATMNCCAQRPQIATLWLLFAHNMANLTNFWSKYFVFFSLISISEDSDLYSVAEQFVLGLVYSKWNLVNEW